MYKQALLLGLHHKTLLFSLTVRSRVRDDQWGGGQGANDHYDRFANDRSIDRSVHVPNFTTQMSNICIHRKKILQSVP